jgi:FRG domain
VSTSSANPARWDRLAEPADGLVAYRLRSWSNFFDFIESEVFSTPEGSKHDYIWRGQRRSDWSLSPSLDRLFDKLDVSTQTKKPLQEIAADHLERFKYAARGRRGPNAAKPESLVENEWWALGQHFGLATPLLDWTRSPFAAAYFAFEELASDPTEHRVVYCLDRLAVAQTNEGIVEGTSVEVGRPRVLEIIDPMYDENARLVSQGGLFTRAPIALSVQQWVADEFKGSTSSVLLCAEIPDADRSACLRALNRMNINHLSLFPDLSGASRSTNLKLELEL